MISTLVIKSNRLCNLRCTYCYYINENTQKYGLQMDDAVLNAMYASFAEHIGENSTEVNLIWHGGEPLMMGPTRFQSVIDQQKQYFKNIKVNNLVQTNGTILSDKWIEFFFRNEVGLSISLDGPKLTHDQTRIDIKGRGTFDRIAKNIAWLKEVGISPGVISVADPKTDAAEFLQTLKELDLHSSDFLLPMTNHTNQRNLEKMVDMKEVGRRLVQAFRKWSQQDDPTIRVRLFEALIMNALGLKINFSNAGMSSDQIGKFVVVETDGEICMDVEYGEIDTSHEIDFYKLGYNVKDPVNAFDQAATKLSGLIEEYKLGHIPVDCRSCPVVSLCRGSHPASRYDDKDNSFNHRSAYCEAMLPLSIEVLSYLDQSNLLEEAVDLRLRPYRPEIRPKDVCVSHL